MSDISIHGCPAPQNITLVQRLQPLVGRTVTVFQPGFPELTKTTGKLSNVTSLSFTVGRTEVVIKTSFFIVLNERVKTEKPFDVTATAEDIGELRGKLIRVGRDFVEFVKLPGPVVPTLFPLNLFTEVMCERENEE
ncbi:hypothetical protein YDYSG_67050 [Paenibacillus tyrfis]|uniref:hypothetical protein n=1 Tax=Paenibacillus TaxID=44249 RepID=UPI002490E092|nr:hypothetical protein [Paenibacillus tyrfis]GLI10669.1 hypothetical protein YDYSG_67050 [Paenibacillus tyrfis]GMX66583.1 hypothetical protein Elgi_58550 [Paenibacillus elgii]